MAREGGLEARIYFQLSIKFSNLALGNCKTLSGKLFHVLTILFPKNKVRALQREISLSSRILWANCRGITFLDKTLGQWETPLYILCANFKSNFNLRDSKDSSSRKFSLCWYEGGVDLGKHLRKRVLVNCLCTCSMSFESPLL